jgi:hypothetical protein
MSLRHRAGPAVVVGPPRPHHGAPATALPRPAAPARRQRCVAAPAKPGDRCGAGCGGGAASRARARRRRRRRRQRRRRRRARGAGAVRGRVVGLPHAGKRAGARTAGRPPPARPRPRPGPSTPAAARGPLPRRRGGGGPDASGPAPEAAAPFDTESTAVVIRCLTARAVQKVLTNLSTVDTFTARWLNEFCATHPPLDGDKVRGWTTDAAGGAGAGQRRRLSTAARCPTRALLHPPLPVTLPPRPAPPRPQPLPHHPPPPAPSSSPTSCTSRPSRSSTPTPAAPTR